MQIYEIKLKHTTFPRKNESFLGKGKIVCVLSICFSNNQRGPKPCAPLNLHLFFRCTVIGSSSFAVFPVDVYDGTGFLVLSINSRL